MPASPQVYSVPPFVPNAASILAGVATTNGGTIITVPAGQTWMGTVTLSASVLVAVGGAAVSASARVSTAGTGVLPAAGDYLRLDLGAPAAGTALAGSSANNGVAGTMVVTAPSGNSVTLVLNTTNTTTQSASAMGYLV